MKYINVFLASIFLLVFFNCQAQYAKNYVGPDLRDLNSLGTTYNKAVTYCQGYRNDTAYILMDEFCDSLQTAQNWSKLLLARNELSTMYIQHGKLSKALDHLNITINNYGNYFDTLCTEFVYTYKLLWFVFYFQEDYEGLERVQDYRYRQVQARTEKQILNRSHYALDIDTYDEISISYKLTKDYKMYYECKKMAFKLAEKIKWRYKLNFLNANLGGDLLNWGDSTYGKSFIKHAYELNPLKTYYDTMFAVSQTVNLAKAYFSENNYKKSKYYLFKALHFIENNDHPFHYEQAGALLLLGNVCANENNNDSTLFYFNAGINLAKKEKSYIYLVDGLVDLANYYENKVGNIDSAIYYYEQAHLVIKTNQEISKDVIPRFWMNYAHFNMNQNYFDSALIKLNNGLAYILSDSVNNLYEVKTIPKNKTSVLLMDLLDYKLEAMYGSCEVDEVDEVDLQKSIVTQFKEFERLTYNLIAENTSKKFIEHVLYKYRKAIGKFVDFYFLNENTTGITPEQLYEIISDAKGMYLQNELFQAEYASLFQTSDKRIGELKKLKEDIFIYENKCDLFRANNQKDSLKRYVNSLLTMRRDAIIEDMILKYELNEKHRHAGKNKELNLNEIQQNIKTDEAFIEYYLNGKNSLVFCTTNNQQYYKQINEPEIKKLYNQIIRNTKTGKINSQLLNELYSKLIEPISVLINNKKYLHIIPSEFLNNLPFETLISKNKKLLIEDYVISYNISTALLIKSKTEKQNMQNNFLGVAPVFKSGNNHLALNNIKRSVFENDSLIFRNNNFVSLLNTEEEVYEISKLFTKYSSGNITLLTNNKATKGCFLDNITYQDIIHIASHGLLNKSNPYTSGIALFPNNSEFSSDDIFYHYELYNRNLSANLVVLSACKTGTGKIIRGEGVMALPRGFIYAGVPNVIASLWKVHDEKTKDLMVAFYKHLLEDKVSYAEALRLAKLDCIKKGFLPVDWAGFVLIGN